MLYYSFVKENLSKNSGNIQREIPIKSANPFLYEYWKVFSYLYFKRLSEKFKNLNSQKYSKNFLKSISVNNLIKKEENNSILSKERRTDSEKEKKSDSIDLNSLNSLNYPFMNNQNSLFDNGIKNSYIETNPKEAHNFLFQGHKPNNILNFGNNYINPPFTKTLHNPQNNTLFSNYQPQKIQYFPNDYNLNPLYPSSNIINNNLRKDSIIDNYNNGENINNINNIPYYQLPLRNHILQNLPTIISSNNILSTSIPNNYMMANNNVNINQNSNLNPEKNINNIKNNLNKTNLDINNNIYNSHINNEKEEKILNPIINKNSMDNKNIINFDSKENNINNSNKDEKINNLIIPDKKEQISLIKPQNLNEKPKIHKIFFNIKESSQNKEGNLLTKKSKRFVKNNKLVFIQMEGNELNLKNKKIIDEDDELEFQQNTKPRGSIFRGVSKNGSQWQVLIMVKKKKRYLGSFPTEQEAARAYDKAALQNHGNKAKTNYEYTKEEIEKILQGPKLLKFE